MKRRTQVMVILAAMFVAAVPAARALTLNSLSATGTQGVIRIRAVHAMRDGNYSLTHGDGTLEQDQSRTVGDEELPSPNGNGPSCLGSPTPPDCARFLSPNDPSVNPSSGDGHTHYHVGDRALIVDEVRGFMPGDTLLLGSPYCNMSFIGETCQRYMTGRGMIDQQPNAEIVHVIGGDLGDGVDGPGVLQLAQPLTRLHMEGEQISKLPTLYPGQNLRADIPNSALLPRKAVAPVTVRAFFIPPKGSREPWLAQNRRPLLLGAKETSGTDAIVYGVDGTTSFFIPREITNTLTVGPSFDVNTVDSWYSVEVSAWDATNTLVADGVARFKVNPVAIDSLIANPTKVLPTMGVQITGGVRDASSAAARTRRVDDEPIDLFIAGPSNSSKKFQETSCSNVDAAPADSCGHDPNTADAHGNFGVVQGGVQDCSMQSVGNCSRGASHLSDTANPGNYSVKASIHLASPPVTNMTQFTVTLTP